MTMMRAVRMVAVLGAIATGFSTSAAAQTNDEVFPQVQWNFSTPGARANGMGRTFIGQADDATAAVTNPAGLMNLTKPQVYAEYKNTDISVDRLAAPDSFKTLQPTTFTSNINALSFVSYSMPVTGQLAVGFSINQFLYYREVFNLSPRQLVDQATGNLINFATFGVSGDVDLKATSFGGSVAYQPMKELMVGVTVSANRLTATTVGTRFDFTTPQLQPLSTVINQTSIDDTSVKPSATIGVIFKPNEIVQAGFTYTRSPKFAVNTRFLANPPPAGSQTRPNPPNLQPFTSPPYPDPASLKINVPDRFGFGVAVHPNSRLLVAADVVRIQYSSLAKDFLITLDYTQPALTPNLFSVNDVTEVHFGGEYNILTGNNPVFVRAGVFTNPNHSTRFAGSTALPPELNNYYNAIYNLLPRDTLVRGTVGGGVVLGPRVQIDAAYVHRKEFVASTGVRF